MVGFLSRRAICLSGAAALLPAPVWGARVSSRPYDTAGGQWRTYGGNLGSWRYTALDRITAGNFNSLQPAWTFRSDSVGGVFNSNLQATPLMINDVLYLTAGPRRSAIAISATTGKLKWEYHLDEGRRAAKSPK